MAHPHRQYRIRARAWSVRSPLQQGWANRGQPWAHDGAGGLVDDSLTVFPVCRDALGPLVIPGQAMDAALDENESKFSVLILSIAIEMLANGDGLLNKHVEILWEFRGEAL
eukprot:GFKZ01012770.1.p2 GENE.GFKZ01012770.1~~GFKZ01012770.1.p2  ORF type:complete len:111 (+),score=0.65 GFKZ01012770.1:508-840(+)